VCSNPAKQDGAICNDGDLCTTADVCTAGVCGGISHINEPHPRTVGYYKALCSNDHTGDHLAVTDAICVADTTATFDTHSVADVCAILLNQDAVDNDDDHAGQRPNSCDKARAELMALALNRCRARVCDMQQIDSDCAGSTSRTVGQSFHTVDGILSGTSPTASSCKDGTCMAKEINSGQSLEIDDLHCDRDDHHQRGGMSCHWSVPRYNDDTSAPSQYEIWRRERGTAAFTRVAIVNVPKYYVEDPGINYEYDVVPVR
jgi:hypothetical protein